MAKKANTTGEQKLSKGTRFESAEGARRLRKWQLIDAKGKVVGRLASEIARIVSGKNKPQYSPHNDCGDFVVVINVDKVRFTGQKLKNKIYYKHTGFVGNMKVESAEGVLRRRPERILKQAVQGMLPKTPLGRSQLTKMKMYVGEKHPHSAQLAAKK